MADDFKVGDVVVCVHEPDGEINVMWGPKVGQIYKIIQVFFWEGYLLVNLAEDPFAVPFNGFEAFAFKHLSKADDTFIQQMRSLKPARTKESTQ